MALTRITSDGITDGTITGTDLATNVDLVDNQKLRLGTGNDLQIYHDGTDSLITNSTGDLEIRGSGTGVGNVLLRPKTGENGVIVKPDDAVELYYDNSKKFETTSDGISLTGSIKIPDDKEVKLGTNTDLRLFHTGNQNYIQSYNGNFNIQSFSTNNIYIKVNESENAVVCNANGAVELYYNGSKKFETYNGGCQMGGDLSFSDSQVANFGTGSDLQIYHDGSDSLIKDAGTGLLGILTNGFRVNNAANNESMIKADENGAVELYYDNSKKFETTSAGAHCHGNLDFFDNHKVRLGTSSDLQIYHDGNNSFIDNTGIGNLNLYGDDINILNKAKTEFKAKFITNGAVELYHDNVKKAETTSDGLQVFDHIKVGQNNDDVASLEVRYSTVPTFLTSSFDGTLGRATWSINARDTSDGSAVFASVNNGNYGTAYARQLSATGGGYHEFGTSSGAGQIATTKFTLNTNGSASLVGALTQNTSDIRLKENITVISDPLTKIAKLKGFTYNWNELSFKEFFDDTENTRAYYSAKEVGVSAQDVQEVQPEAVKPASNENYFTVQYERLVPLLIEAVKELSVKVAALEAG